MVAATGRLTKQIWKLNEAFPVPVNSSGRFDQARGRREQRKSQSATISMRQNPWFFSPFHFACRPNWVSTSLFGLGFCIHRSPTLGWSMVCSKSWIASMPMLRPCRTPCHTLSSAGKHSKNNDSSRVALHCIASCFNESIIHNIYTINAAAALSLSLCVSLCLSVLSVKEGNRIEMIPGCQHIAVSQCSSCSRGPGLHAHASWGLVDLLFHQSPGKQKIVRCTKL